ncbi:MAG: NAD-dependent epimerase/dehydratase family protein [Sphingobacteriales bacterium]|nr:MAG: NAD-dependent epimerase/dehydratase family protein [Sphingobacteriales bacterium]
MILVTGASGFVGQHLVRFLSAKGHTIRALYNSRKPDHELKSLPGVQWMQCDLLDIYAVEEVMQDITDVYHCAAIVSFHPADKERILHVNIETTANLVNEALERGIRKMVHLSSVAALGGAIQGKEITEEEEWEESRHNSVYGQSKYMAEMEVWRGVGEGLSAAIVNPGIILGPGNWEEGSARLMKVVDKEFPFYTEGVNAWVDVYDVVKAMYTLMNIDVAAERFIMSAGNFSYREVFTKMANALNRKPPHIKASNWMTALIWRWSVLKSSIFGETATITKETAGNAQRKSYYNNSKLLAALPGFGYTPIDETIRQMAAAYMATNKR